MTVPQKTSIAPQPRRLNFSKPDPKLRLSNDEVSKIARAKRALAPERHRDPPRDRPRLPGGARFDVTYDAERIEWRGSLTVGEVVISGRHGAVMGLLSKLDEQYRDHIAEAAAKQPIASQG